MRKRTSFAKIGAIILSVVMGLGLMGIGVSYWSETLNITATLETGTYGAQLSDEVDCYTVPASDNITCEPVGNVLGVAITSAHVGVNYYCEFSLEHIGSIPVKIQSIDVDPSPPASGVVVGITGVAVDDQIDPGQAVDGKVHVYLSDDTSQGTDFDFTVTFSSIIWNQ